MNNTFNIQRFGLLLKRQWLEFGKIYLITLGVAAGVIIAFYSFSLWRVLIEKVQQPYVALDFREPLFTIFGFLFITVIASNYFAHLGQKSKAIIDLLIPASTFEKFLAGIFFTAVLSSIAYLLIFFVTDLAFVSKLRNMYPNIFWTYTTDATEEKKDLITYFFSRYAPKEFTSIYVIVPFFITSIFLLGSIYFNKYHYIKTTIAVMIFSGIWGYIIVNTAELVFKGRVAIYRNSSIEVDNPKLWAEIGIFCLILLLTAIIWRITYQRLKEKEV
ncbi:MAG: hypothetical protein V4546_13095 [Bacteroidota bacterium]